MATFYVRIKQTAFLSQNYYLPMATIQCLHMGGILVNRLQLSIHSPRKIYELILRRMLTSSGKSKQTASLSLSYVLQ